MGENNCASMICIKSIKLILAYFIILFVIYESVRHRYR